MVRNKKKKKKTIKIYEKTNFEEVDKLEEKNTEIVTRRSINVARILVFILFIYILVCIFLYFYNMPIRHYEISGNNYLSDNDILKFINLEDYPSYINLNSKKKENELKENVFINNCKIKHKWNFTIYIEVEENKPLLYLKESNEILLSDGNKIENNGDFEYLPTLINEASEESLTKLANSLKQVESGIFYMISEFEYRPSVSANGDPIDSNRFLVTMNDNNLVYITAKKSYLLNKYLDIISTDAITGKGTLYLDGDEERYSFKLFKE